MNISRLLPLTAVLFSGLSLPAAAQVRITEVNVSARNVEITNFGTTTVNLSGWFFCHRFTYPSLSGSIAPGESRQFSVSFDRTSSDLCLYTSSAFASATALEDFIQWGAGGIGRESVAAAKGIWTTGSFFTVPATGVSYHAKAQPPASGLRLSNWFTALPHAGFPVPAPALETGTLTGGTWTLTVNSRYLPASLIPEVNTSLTGTWTTPAVTRTDLGSGRVRLTFPAASGAREFARVRAQP